MVELIRLLDDKDKEVNVIITSNHIRVEFKELTFTSKLIDGKFPDYKKVVPVNNDKLLVVSSKDFINILKKIAV